MRSFAAVLALGCFAVLPASAQQLVKERLPNCLACHGENGQSQIEDVPSLGAQQAFYVTVQLLMFREKMRVADPMNDMTKGLTDTDLQGFAEVISQLPAPKPATGPVDDGTLAGLYERARLLAYVPLVEGFGFPPVEAMRQGIPVVASAMPSLGGAGLTVDPHSVEDIAAGLVRAATDEGLRATLVAGGIERTAPLTWAQSARAHVALWESLGGESLGGESPT